MAERPAPDTPIDHVWLKCKGCGWVIDLTDINDQPECCNDNWVLLGTGDRPGHG